MTIRFPSPVFAPDAPVSPAPSNAAPDSGASTVSTPSPATPTVATPAAPSEAGVDPSSFEFMFGPEGGDPSEGPGLSPPAKATPEPSLAQPAQAEPAKPAATAPVPAKPDPATATPAPTEATSPVTATTLSPTLDPYDPGTLARHLADNEDQVVLQLADSMFKLSDKDVEELESNTVGTIPRLLARSFVAAQKNFLMQMANIVPRMVQAHGEVTKRHSEAVGEFYTRWPDINKVKDQQVDFAGQKVSIDQLVTRYAVVYRQMNPQASRQDAIEAVGPMVMMAAKVVPSVQPATQPTVKPSPMASSNGRPPQPAPFVPAGPSAGGASMSTAPQLSAIEAMFVGNPDEA